MQLFFNVFDCIFSFLKLHFHFNKVSSKIFTSKVSHLFHNHKNRKINYSLVKLGNAVINSHLQAKIHKRFDHLKQHLYNYLQYCNRFRKRDSTFLNLRFTHHDNVKLYDESQFSMWPIISHLFLGFPTLTVGCTCLGRILVTNSLSSEKLECSE